MVGIVKVNAKVKVDSSSDLIEIPILLTDQGVIDSLLEYILHHRGTRSASWMNRTVFSCQLLLEYMNANKNLFSEPNRLFSRFVYRLSAGTISDSGEDRSGLYWLPRRASNVNQLISALNQFTDWLSITSESNTLNPLIVFIQPLTSRCFSIVLFINQLIFLYNVSLNFVHLSCVTSEY